MPGGRSYLGDGYLKAGTRPTAKSPQRSLCITGYGCDFFGKFPGGKLLSLPPLLGIPSQSLRGRIIINKYPLPHALSYFPAREGLSALFCGFRMDLSLQLFSTL